MQEFFLIKSIAFASNFGRFKRTVLLTLPKKVSCLICSFFKTSSKNSYLLFLADS